LDLVDRVNDVIRRMERMSEEERDRFAGEVIDWIVKMFSDIKAAMDNGGVVKAAKVANAYRQQLENIDRKATAIACLIYAIKEKYQEKLAPVLIGVMGLV